LSIYLALGANQHSVLNGKSLSPPDTFKHAISLLEKSAITTVAKSGLWESPAWPDPLAQPAYINAVIEVEIPLQPIDLLLLIKKIEKLCGRKDDVRNAPRPLDLDILDYNRQTSISDSLTLPHPRMCERAFVLFPLQEIAPNWSDPIENRAIQDWIARLSWSDVKPLKRLGSFI
jgi:2-amino-4-hydroxy-6-hydroxymethyldihydropteridine diphosphokinase